MKREQPLQHIPITSFSRYPVLKYNSCSACLSTQISSQKAASRPLRTIIFSPFIKTSFALTITHHALEHPLLWNNMINLQHIPHIFYHQVTWPMNYFFQSITSNLTWQEMPNPRPPYAFFFVTSVQATRLVLHSPSRPPKGSVSALLVKLLAS